MIVGDITVAEGAYYAANLALARQEKRIGKVGLDPLMTIRLFMDIGGTGAKADSFTIWAAQFIGREIRVLNYYESVGQPIATHLAWMRTQGYTPETSEIWLTHDGSTHDRIYDVSSERGFKLDGYNVNVVKN